MKRQLHRFCAFVFICTAVILNFIYVFPGVRIGFFLPACAAVALGTGYWFYRCPFRSFTGAYVLAAAFTAVTCGILVNVNYFTIGSGGTYAAPVLHNWDCATDWQNAVDRYEGINPHTDTRRMYGLAIALMFKLFGVDITVPLVANLLCYTVTVIAVGSIAWTMTKRRAMATAAMIATVLMCYLMEQSVVLIKDVTLTCLTALFLRWLISWRPTALSAATGLILATGIGLLRINFLIFIVMLCLLFAIPKAQRRHNLLAALAAASLFLILQGTVGAQLPAAGIISAGGTGDYQVAHGNSAAWDAILGNYSTMALWHKVLMLPLSLGVQFIIPLPWTWQSYLSFGPMSALAHFGFFWYAAGGLVIYFLFCTIRRAPLPMALLCLSGVAMTAATALVTGGYVSRYCLPYLPALLPCAAYTALSDWRRRSFRIWAGVFTALMATVLIIGWRMGATAS